MPRIKHIALTTKDPAKVAAFYKEAFGLREIRRNPRGAVFLTDGYINLAILNWKTEKDADVGANGPNYSGFHHIGFEVEDLDEASQNLERADGVRLTAKDGVDMGMAGAVTAFRNEVGRSGRRGDRHLPHRVGNKIDALRRRVSRGLAGP